ncbi:hypothetical protein BJ166DRAFT_65414 [Pestalotiopsis sp. NC0098]|nr:hypothetical protein BJ166DRAFT_65414 [Pestalotiopsis sp. NC0098]
MSRFRRKFPERCHSTTRSATHGQKTSYNTPNKSFRGRGSRQLATTYVAGRPRKAIFAALAGYGMGCTSRKGLVGPRHRKRKDRVYFASTQNCISWVCRSLVSEIQHSCRGRKCVSDVGLLNSHSTSTRRKLPCKRRINMVKILVALSASLLSFQ